MTDVVDHMTSGATRPWGEALLRGLTLRCPACGIGSMFGKYLKVADGCQHCGEELHHHRADDAPPYFTIFIVGHIVIPLVLIVEQIWHPNLFLHAGLWVSVTLALTFFLMPRVKGAVVAAQWAMKMHGFDYASRGEPEVEALDKEPIARA